MSRKAYIEDLDDLFERQPDSMPQAAALAIYGYLKGLRHAGVISFEDYRTYWDRLPLEGQDLDKSGINI